MSSTRAGRGRARGRARIVATLVLPPLVTLAACSSGSTPAGPPDTTAVPAPEDHPSGEVTVNTACGIRELRWGGRWWTADPPYVHTRSSSSDPSSGVLFVSASVTEVRPDDLLVTGARLAGPVHMHPSPEQTDHVACRR